MSAFNELSKLLKVSLSHLADLYNYSQANKYIISGKEAELIKEYPNIYENIISCRHNRDNREPMEYAKDLVASWLFEDAIIDIIKSAGIEIYHSGTDRNREILSSKNVSSDSDYMINLSGEYMPLEVMTDYTGYWTQNHKIDLRDQKYNKLVKSRSLFLGVSTKDRQFIILDFRKDINAIYEPHYSAYGGKDAYAVEIDPKNMISFTSKNLIDTIKNIK